MTDVAKLMVKVGADIGDAQKGLKQVHSDVQGATTSMNSLGRASALALGGLLVAGAAAAAAGLAYASVSAMKFEQTMSGVKAVSGASAIEMAQLNALALQLGKDTVFSAAQAGQGLEELVKGGVSIDNIMGGAAKAVLNLASAGGVDLKSAAEIAANAMSMFGLKGTDMAHVTDQIAGAANASSLDVQDFRLSLQAVGAVANLTGQSFDSTATAIAVMGAAGIKSSDAGTSLKTMLMNLQPQTDKAREEFDKLGITVNGTGNKFIDANGNFKDMGAIAEVLRVAMMGLTKAQQEESLAIMFGTDAIRAGATLARGGADAFNTMAASMSKVTAESVAAERLNNLAGDLEQLKGSAETLAISFGVQLTPKLREVTQAGTKFLNEAIEKLPGAMRDAETAMMGLTDKYHYFADAAKDGSSMGRDFNWFLEANSTALDIAAGFVGGLTGLYIAINAPIWAAAAATGAMAFATNAATLATKALTVALALGPWGWVAIGIGAIAAALVTAYNSSTDFHNAFNSAMSAAGTAATNFANVAGGAMSGLGSILQGVLNWAVDVTAALGGIPRRVDVTIAVNRVEANLMASHAPYADPTLMASHDTTNYGAMSSHDVNSSYANEAADRSDAAAGQAIRDNAIQTANAQMQAIDDVETANANASNKVIANAAKVAAAINNGPVRALGGGGSGGGLADAEKAAADAEKAAADARIKHLQEATSAVQNLQSALDDLSNTPLLGMGAFDAEQTKFQDRINEIDLQQKQLAGQRGSRAELRTLEKERLGLEQKMAVSQAGEIVKMGPQQRALQEALNPPLPEASLQDILTRVTATRGGIQAARNYEQSISQTNNVTVNVDASGHVAISGGDPALGQAIADGVNKVLAGLVIAAPSTGARANPALPGGQ